MSITEDNELQDGTGERRGSHDAQDKRSRDKSPDVASGISVIVLSKDERDLAITLTLLRPQCEALGAECIVVDASRRRLEYIRETHPWTTWIDYSGPFWRSSTIPHQRNAGCKAATGDVIVFCDSGGEPQPDWLRSITTPLTNGQRTLVCGPIHAKSAGVFPVINDVADGEVVSSAPTANMAFLKAVFDEVSGFDERLYYGSDYDFVWRCTDKQHPCFLVRAAVMFMDWGSPSLTFRRSWRYGRGWARLYSVHPERHGWMIRKSPERLAYPIWILFGPLVILAGARRKFRWVFLAWLGLLGLPLLRNRKYQSPFTVVADHVVAGASVLDETCRRIIGEVGPVVFLPDEEIPYLRHLSDSLAEQGTPVSFWSGPTKLATMNILLGPLWLAILAWRGARIVHIHWTYEFSRSSGALGGRMARWWFKIFLQVAHKLGLKIVWTVHNILPHEPVFDNDIEARRILVDHCDAIIALSPHGGEEVSTLFGASNVAVIAHGPLELPPTSAGRDNARELLDIGDRPCFSFFGNIRPYKGIETLIKAAELLGQKVAVRIAGQGDPTYVTELIRMVHVANSAGADVRLEPRWQSDFELADFLAASDFCVFPFDKVESSGSVLLSLATGVPVIIPDLPSLSHIDNKGVLYFDAANPVFALGDVMKTAASLSSFKRAELGNAAREWTSQFEWSAIAEETARVYARTMLGE